MSIVRELEDALYEHPAVLDGAVIVHSEDNIAIFVQLKEGVHVDIDELTAYCWQKIGESWLTIGFHIVDYLPKTKTGKISRYDLLAKLSAQPTEALGF